MFRRKSIFALMAATSVLLYGHGAICQQYSGPQGYREGGPPPGFSEMHQLLQENTERAKEDSSNARSHINDSAEDLKFNQLDEENEAPVHPENPAINMNREDLDEAGDDPPPDGQLNQSETSKSQHK